MPDLRAGWAESDSVSSWGGKWGRKKGESLQENPWPVQPHWLSHTDCPAAPFLQHLHAACARAKGCPAAPVFHRHSGKTDLKPRMAVAAPQATENTECNEVPGGYCSLLLTHSVTLQKDNWRQSLVSIFTTTLIFLSAGDTISSLKITPF